MALFTPFVRIVYLISIIHALLIAASWVTHASSIEKYDQLALGVAVIGEETIKNFDLISSELQESLRQAVASGYDVFTHYPTNNIHKNHLVTCALLRFYILISNESVLLRQFKENCQNTLSALETLYSELNSGKAAR